jgi:hypothetical protein
MPTLDVWPIGHASATDEYWNFRQHCVKIHRALYGPHAYDHLSLRDIMNEELYKSGATLSEKHNDVLLTFRSEQHKTMWLIQWSN